ncbi:MAG TPA: 6-bladed beta-propeller [Caldisericia bacterium]|nr:6-bladed beta-propeller [Caldisericia bacterium]
MRFLSILSAIAIISASSFPVGIIGIRDDGSHFKYPKSVFVDPESKNMFVADTGNKRIVLLKNDDGTFIMDFGKERLKNPTKVIQDKGSRLLVCDPEAKAIHLFDRKGAYLADFSVGNDPVTGIVEPISLAFDKNGRFFVLDHVACQIKIFESSGEFLFSMGSKGDGEGQFLEPSDVAIDADGNVYATDTGNNRVVVFDKTGNFKISFGQDELSHPTGIAINSTSVYVSNTGKHEISVFSKKDFIYKGNYGTIGAGNPQLRFPMGLCLDSDQKLWIADSGNCRIVQTQKLEFIKSIGTDGITISPKGLVLKDGMIYVSEPEANCINVYEAQSGSFSRSIGLQGTSLTSLNSPQSCCISSRDDLIVADTGNHRIQVYSLSGEHLVSFGSQGSGIGQFESPTSIACTKSGNIIVTDSGNSRVCVLTLGGAWQFDITKELKKPVAVAEDMIGNIWVCDQELGKVLIFDQKGNQVNEIQGFNRPSAIFCDAMGRLFVTDEETGLIKVFSTTGYELAVIGGEGGPMSAAKPPFLPEQPGKFFKPHGVTASDDYVYVSDTGNSRIQKIPLAAFGGLPKLGTDKSALDFPKVPRSSKRSQTLKITNDGDGLIEGTISADQPWIVLGQATFTSDTEVTITLDGTKAPEGQREGTITIQSNGGIAKIKVTGRFFTGQIKRLEIKVGSNTVISSGKKIYVTPAPLKDTKYNKVYTAFRFIGEELGADVILSGKKIIYILEGRTLQLTIGSQKAQFQGKEIDMGSPCYMYGKVPLVPLRFVAETLGATLMSEGNKIIVEYP